MTGTEPQTVLIGVFATHAAAERFVEELRRAGFREDQVGVATPGGEGTDRATRVEETALVGAISGGTMGVFAGLLLSVLPGVGPVLAGGLLVGLLSSVAVGATAGGLLGALLGLGVSAEHARRYEQHVRAGRTLVVVKAAQRYGEALDILHRCETHEPPARHGGANPPGARVLDKLT